MMSWFEIEGLWEEISDLLPLWKNDTDGSLEFNIGRYFDPPNFHFRVQISQ
jgi:hypothetical protein